MFFTVVSPKYQMTLGKETRALLGIKPGTRLMGIIMDGGVFVKPVGDFLSSYGVFHTGKPPLSREEEQAGMEQAIAESVLGIARDE